jgi:hypothetical protein
MMLSLNTDVFSSWAEAASSALLGLEGIRDRIRVRGDKD